MNQKLFISKDDAEKVLAILEIEYHGDYSAESILEEMQNHQIFGFELRQFLTMIVEQEHDTLGTAYEETIDFVKVSDRGTLIEFYQNMLFIDNCNALGNGDTFEEDAFEEDTFEEEALILEDEEENDSDFSEYELNEAIGEEDAPFEDMEEEDNEEFELTDRTDTEELYTETGTYSDLEEDSENYDDSMNEKFKPYFDPLDKAQHFYEEIKEQIHIIPIGEMFPEVYFDTSPKNTIYEGTDITTNDNISLTIKFQNDTLYHRICLIVNENGKVVINGRLVPAEEPDSYFIEALQRNIDFEGIRKGSFHFHVVFVNMEVTDFYAGVIDLRFGKRELSEKILCVDFGTSNTTCGIYQNNHIHIVQFEDITAKEHKRSGLCPTLVYVRRILKKNIETQRAEQVEYLFGYEAKQMLLLNDYNPKGSVFFEIKRWITSPEDLETITDGDTEALISRKEIIRAYLNYIVSMAENDLKCIFYRMHFSAPVKMKSKFIQFLQDDIFNGKTANKPYEIMNASESIDEGVAIIYNHISENIANADNTGTNTTADGKIIIVDCGGGTTDLASCSYRYTKKMTGYDLELQTRFENGNSNFGGNNITYRIFEFLKIKFASVLAGSTEEVKVKDLMEIDDNDALNAVDLAIATQSRLKIYDKLDNASREAEKILPTDFDGSSIYAQKITTKKQTKRNFYFLWQLAEKIKLALFAENDISSVVLNPRGGVDYFESVVLNEKLSFYVKNPDERIPPLKFCDIPENVHMVVRRKEIISLIQPDIYYLLASILDLDNIETLNQCSYIKLSGQSCKIGVFRSLLKEFVAGRKLRSGDALNPPDSSADKYKLDCVCGCITYIRDKEFHFVNSFNKQTNQNIIFDVELSRGGMGNRTLFEGNVVSDSNRMTAGKNVLHLELYKPSKGILSIHVLHSNNDRSLENELEIPMKYTKFSEFRLSSLYREKDELKALYTMLSDRCYATLILDKAGKDRISCLVKEIDSVSVESGESRILVFAIPNSDGYSFTLYQILKSNENGKIVYYRTDQRNLNFENGVSFRSFFNGKNCEIDSRYHRM